jgi:hypothetical protein
MARKAATDHFGVPPTEDITEFEAGHQVGFMTALSIFGDLFKAEKQGTEAAIARLRLMATRGPALADWEARMTALESFGIRVGKFAASLTSASAETPSEEHGPDTAHQG